MGELTGDETARFFYLSLLGIFIASGLLYHYRGQLGTAIRHLLIWALIICGFVLIYAFREPFLSAVNPGRVQSSDEVLVLNRASDGHFYARILVNGVGIDFAVDTGASDIVLPLEEAARAGIETADLRFIGSAQTANGVVSIAPVRLRELRFGPLTARNVPASVNGGELSIALLGMSFLERFTSITIENDRMFLRP